jgi:hypothetical protein
VSRIDGVIDIIELFFLLPCAVAYLLCYFFYLRRLWEEVPRQFARTTPGTAAGLSLIPVFGWYWMFVALPGLYQDMNKAMESYGHAKRFNTTLIIAACILWLVSDLVAILMALVTAVVSYGHDADVVIFLTFLSLVFGIIWTIFTMIMYWIIRNKVQEFIDIKASVER